MAAGPATAADRQSSEAYAWVVVAILMVAYVFSFIDRQILSLLVGPIRRDLGISDTGMSLLMGLSFALFYSLLGIPLGRLADARSRRGLIMAGVAFWSLMTALCGAARNYWQLFLCRIGVGVGEAALSPAAYSMIADYFPPHRRGFAMGVYSAGITLGSGIALLLGGLIVHFVSGQERVDVPLAGPTRPWQAVFYLLGSAGLVFSMAFLFVREPVRSGANAAAGVVPMREVVAYLWRNRRAVFGHNLGFALSALCAYSAQAWTPSFFIRSFGWEAGRIGMVYGVLVLVFGTAGIVFGGRLMDRWMKQGHADAALRVGLVSAAIALVSNLLYLSMPNATLALVAMMPAVFALSMPFGAAPSAIQEIVPGRMRGQAVAIYLLIVSLIGLGIGPTAVALLTDYLFADDGALRWSLMIVLSVAGVASMLLLAAARGPFCETWARLRGTS